MDKFIIAVDVDGVILSHGTRSINYSLIEQLNALVSKSLGKVAVIFWSGSESAAKKIEKAGVQGLCIFPVKLFNKGGIIVPEPDLAIDDTYWPWTIGVPTIKIAAFIGSSDYIYIKEDSGDVAGIPKWVEVEYDK